jgi:hypothetical protein
MKWVFRKTGTEGVSNLSLRRIAQIEHACRRGKIRDGF